MSIFMILLIIGVAIPAVSVALSAILGSIGRLFNLDIDADVGTEGGGLIEMLLPISPIIWCVQLIVTGSVGETLKRSGNFDVIPIWVIAIIAGYVGMLLVNNCIMIPLKRAKNYTDTVDCLLGARAEVIETINENGTGAVKIRGNAGSTIYAAKCPENTKISQGETVRVINIKDGVATVEKEETN
jgi:membrane-bound ClpP family serine protease